MEIILLFGVSILPALGLIWYYDRYDRKRPEPRQMIWKAFKWGLIATFFAGVFEQNLFYLVPNLIEHPFIRAFVISFLVVAIVEEGVKLLIVRKIIWESKYFDERMDGIIYCIVASLGFATLENLFYVFEGGFEVGLVRAIMAVPAHALFSGIMGYYIGKAKMSKLPWGRNGLMWKGYLIAIMYHGLYDFFLMTESYLLMFFVVPLLILMFFQLLHKIRLAHFEDGLTKQEPMKWGFRRFMRFGFGLLLILFAIYYVSGIQLMIELGQYRDGDMPLHAIVMVVIVGGIYWSLRYNVLPKVEWQKQLRIKKDVRKARLRG